MDQPLMSLLKATDGELEFFGRRREDRRKPVFLVGPRAQIGIDSSAYDQAVLRRLSTMVGHPILLNGG